MFVLCHCTANVTWVESLLFKKKNILQAFILLRMFHDIVMPYGSQFAR